MNTYNKDERLVRWDIYLANVKYEDCNEWKPRPILIIKDKCTVAVSIKMTTHEPRKGEYRIIKWQEAQLHYPTTIRLSKRLELDKDLIIKPIGRLQVEDIENIEPEIKRRYKADFDIDIESEEQNENQI